jgi:hypothetical protein
MVHCLGSAGFRPLKVATFVRQQDWHLRGGQWKIANAQCPMLNDANNT